MPGRSSRGDEWTRGDEELDGGMTTRWRASTWATWRLSMRLSSRRCASRTVAMMAARYRPRCASVAAIMRNLTCVFFVGPLCESL